MNHENKPVNEDLFRDKLTELLQAKMRRETPKYMQRDAHPKQHGLVKGTFKVVADLPVNLQHGVLVSGRSYDAWVRFSNQNAPSQADTKKDIRGAAIKLMNVPGDKLDVTDGNTTSQDFITISTPMFVTHNVEEFFYLIKALVKGKLALLWHFLFHPRSLLNLLKSNKNYLSPLQTRYWSTTPYKLGPQQVVKYSLIPHAGVVTQIPHNSGPDFLRENMVKQLQGEDFDFDFCVQLQTDPKLMPVEDPGKRWPEHISPFIKVATLTIPQQTFDTPAQNAYGIVLSFNPWHSLPAHQPLGGINRVRRVIYKTLSDFRHQYNSEPQTEPTNYEIPTDLLKAAQPAWADIPENPENEE
ncbi:MAG TPA: catalase family protein [Cellvibrio sp.]|nr:catalase family protein [Cellvibrio sp.]